MEPCYFTPSQPRTMVIIRWGKNCPITSSLHVLLTVRHRLLLSFFLLLLMLLFLFGFSCCCCEDCNKESGRDRLTGRQTDKEERDRLTVQTLSLNGEEVKRPTCISVVATVLTVIKTYIETETGRQTETERQTDRQRHTERDRDRETERQRTKLSKIENHTGTRRVEL